MSTRWSKFRNTLRAFQHARDGNVAILFGLAIIPIIAFVGAAVDYSRANMVKTSMQGALDAVSLMMSKNASSLSDASVNGAPSALDAKALELFLALFNRPEATNIHINATYTSNSGSSVSVSGTADVATTFMQLVGFPKVPVGASSTSKWGGTRLRVALVLDNTGSMASDGKIDALKTATTNLLTQLQGTASVDGDVYVSIVPFVKDVSFPVSAYTSAWDSTNGGFVYWDDGVITADNYWNALNGTCTGGSGSSRSTCISAGHCSISGNTYATCQNAGTCSLSGYTTASTCTAAGTCSKSGYTTQSTCLATGTCSKSTYTTQATCIANGTCSVSTYTSQSTCTANGVCSISGKTSQSTCLAAGVCSNPGQTTQGSCTGTKACTKSQYTSKNPCTNNGGVWGFGTWTTGVWTWNTWTPYTWTAATWTPGVWTGATWSTTWTPASHTTWNGCITERGGPTGPVSDYDRLVTQPTNAIAGTLFPAEQYGSCPLPMMGLSYDWNAMKTEVSNMVANGSTNQPIGLVWGWQTLVGGGPFTQPPLDANYTYQTIIILLSDGLNTQDRWYGNGSSTSTQVDYRMYDSSGNGTCANIKAANITIYTIQVNTGGDPTSTLMQNCATSSDKFFLLTSADQIVTTFEKIGTQLSKLRIAY